MNISLKYVYESLEKISSLPKIAVSRQRKRKIGSAANLASSPFKKQLEEYEKIMKKRNKQLYCEKKKLHKIRHSSRKRNQKM